MTKATAEDFSRFVKELIGKKKFIVALDSEAYMHIRTARGVQVKRGSGGAQNLLDGILRQVGGTMVAVAKGNADKYYVDKNNKVHVPPESQLYTLKRIFLDKQELDGYYYGFANQTIWPMCHLSFVKPKFEYKWWKEYKKVNQKFADAILEEVGDGEAFVWVNDYQLCLLPELLKKANPKLKIGVFWHIPWPIEEILNICPWRKELLQGLIAADFIGFHREKYYENFRKCAIKDLDITVMPSQSSLLHNKHVTRLGAIPAGIDYYEIEETLKSIGDCREAVKKDFDFEYEYLAISVDRLDYTKGFLERLHTIDMFLQNHPEFHKKFVYLMIGAPTRTHIPAYKNLGKDVENLILELNWKYSINGWEPIKFVNTSITRERIFAYYHCADVCFVNSLDDGMNLVAKEYVVCCEAKKGMLLLSEFAGAAKELSSALLINPYDTQQACEALYKALTMSPKEKLKRNNAMKKELKKNTIAKWGKDFIYSTSGPY